MSDKLEFQEPTGEESEAAGYRIYKRAKSPYEQWMEEEGIPVFRGVGVYNTRELDLAPWKRMGGKGMFLFLDGVQDEKGMYVVEVPPGGSLNPEKHMYDEFFLVIDGRGSTEVWRDGQAKPAVFEWQSGSLFTAPINTWHRIVNATSSPALILAANNAPPIFNIYQSHRYIFDNAYTFTERFDGSDDFFKPKTEIEAEPVRGRASIKSNIFTDIINCELPLDNQRVPGYRRIQPLFHGYMQEPSTGGFMAQYPSGRYSKGHYHRSGAVIVCLRGKGYSFNWPLDVGPHPWETGNGHTVQKTEYVAGGLVAAAPGGGNWFHQHFSIGKQGMRTINYWGGPSGGWGLWDEEGEDVKAGNLFSLSEGGRTVMYWEEDPYIRKYYAQRLAEEGVEMAMPESLYERPLVQAGV